MVVLGIWDGHDSGASLIVDGRIVAAVNEERLSRRKLEIRFPISSIRCCMEIGGATPSDVDIVACSTWDLAKTLARLFPSTKERYYALRRRKAEPGRLGTLQKRFKYWMTEAGGNAWSRGVSAWHLRRKLKEVGFKQARVKLYDHHYCHAIAAAATSGFDDCVVLTLDGVGDGLSSTVSVFHGGQLHRIAATSARDSLGVLFEHVTNLLNMRELEDEGKVMAVADFAIAVPDSRNEVLSLVGIDHLETRLAVPGHRLYSRLKKIQWRVPNEQLARMAQRTVEVSMARLVSAAVNFAGTPRVALSGGVASNIKANRIARLLPEVEDIFVFPHMGDGGLALGAAVAAAVEAGEAIQRDVGDLALGPGFSDGEIAKALGDAGLQVAVEPSLTESVADLLAQDKIVMWFQGRMEYGPRALGQRSIFARPDRQALRDRLNLILKQRVWYQPFCPTILESDAIQAFSDWKGRANRHMTMAYVVKPEYRSRLAGVLGPDGSCRPQIVADESGSVLGRLLQEVRRRIGVGAVLNTSFNIHGEPIVCAPSEAIEVYHRSEADVLAIGPYLVRRQM